MRQLISKEQSQLSPFPPFMISLTGQLVSGKNQVQLLFRNGKVMKYPNKVFKNWRNKAAKEIGEQFMGAPNIEQPIRLTCNYWPGDRRTRDVSGQLDAIFHVLVHTQVIKDDGLIYDVVWKRQEMNRKFPKVVMELEAYP